MSFVSTIKVLLKFTTVFGIIPFSYNSKMNIFEVTSFQLFKSIAIGCFILAYDFSIVLPNIIFGVEFEDKQDNTSGDRVTNFSTDLTWILQAIGCTIFSFEFALHCKSYVKLLNDLLLLEKIFTTKSRRNFIIDYTILKYSLIWDFSAIFIDFIWQLINELLKVIYNIDKRPTFMKVLRYFLEKYYAALGLSFLQSILVFIIILRKSLMNLYKVNKRNINITKFMSFEVELQSQIEKISQITPFSCVTICCLLFVALMRYFYNLILDTWNNITIIFWVFSVTTAYIKFIMICDICGKKVLLSIILCIIPM